MSIVKSYYKWKHPGVPNEKIPNKYKISLWQAIKKLVRKYLSAVVIPTIPFNNMRVSCYRLIGYKIGKSTFIGMRCYLDDLAYDKIEIGSHVTISYGVYFACHGKNQARHRIVIEDGVYIGMRSSIIAPKGDVIIEKNSIIGAQSLINKSIPAGITAVGCPCKVIEEKETK